MAVLLKAMLTLGATLVLCHPLQAQTAPDRTDRWKFLSPSTQVSDDPRRVPTAPGPRGPDGTLVLHGARIFDGTGSPVREGSLVIQRNRILKVLPAGSADWPKDARVVEVAGKTVMPGLIDLHTHLTYSDPTHPVPADDVSDSALRGAERLRYFLESGVTSVRDVGSDPGVFRLKTWVRDNRIPGPRVFAAGHLITGLGGHGSGLPSVREASGPDDWRQAVREEFKRGADLIKIASHFSPEEAAAAIHEAHDLGLKVTCDCETFYIRRAVDAGVDMIEHPLPRDDETIRLMARKGVENDPTLVSYGIIFDISGGYYNSTSRRFTFSRDANLEMLRRLKRAGIKMAVGTDLVFDWYRYLPAPYIVELKNFVAAGYTIPEALKAGTKTNAEMLDMGDRLGTLEPGKLADVAVIDGKPDANLDDLRKVDMVIRDGDVVLEQGRIFVPRHVPVAMPDPNGPKQ